MPVSRRDPFAGLPETTEFMVLLPEVILEDEDRRDDLLDHLEAAFPGASFRAVRCECLRSPEGAPVVINDPLVVPVMGSAGEGADPKSQRRRPSDDRMRDIMGTMTAFIGGAAALN
jgi:hypothetical protein